MRGKIHSFNTKAILTGMAFMLIFGILGYQYFDYVTYEVNKIIWETKGLLGIEQSRGVTIFKTLPGWANTIAGTIIGWAVKKLLDWIYVKIRIKYFDRKRRRKNL